MVLARNSASIPLVLKEFHDTAAEGHSGYFRTYKSVAALVYWEGMKKDIHMSKGVKFVRETSMKHSLVGLLHPLLVPTSRTDLSVDFLGGLPKFKGLDTILLVVDRLTKYSHFIALSHPYTAKEVAEVFVKEMVWPHGFPQTIDTDHDRLSKSILYSTLQDS